MGFCNKTKSIIESSYQTVNAAEITDIIKNAGLRETKEKSVAKYIAKLVERDEKRSVAREKRAKKALADPIAYRASTLLNGAKTRAELIGNPFDLTKEWLIEKLKQGRCEMTGIEFFIKPYSSREEYTKVHPFSPSLDQIRPAGGYTMDNVQVVCDQFNKLKGDRHVVSAYKLATQFVSTYKSRHTPIVKQVKASVVQD